MHPQTAPNKSELKMEVRKKFELKHDFRKQNQSLPVFYLFLLFVRNLNIFKSQSYKMNRMIGDRTPGVYKE